MAGWLDATPDHGRGRYPRTSSVGRDMRAARYGVVESPEAERDYAPAGSSLAGSSWWQAGVSAVVFEFGMTEQTWDHADIDVLLQQMWRSYAAGVQRTRLSIWPSAPPHGRQIELARRDRCTRSRPGNSSPGPCRPPPGAQQFRAGRRESIT